MLSKFVYQLRFSGGPHDGLRAFSTDLPTTDLEFPIGRTASPTACIAYHRLPGVDSAVYRFERTELVGKLPHVMPVIYFRFERFRAAPRPRMTARASVLWPIKALSATINQLVAGLAHWLRHPRGFHLHPANPGCHFFDLGAVPRPAQRGNRPGAW